MEFKYRSKYDYQKHKRTNVHTTIRQDLYELLQTTAFNQKEYSSKCLDVIIEMVLKDKKLFNEFNNKIKHILIKQLIIINTYLILTNNDKYLLIKLQPIINILENIMHPFCV